MAEQLTGLDRVVARADVALPNGRFGLLANQASVDRQLRPAWEVLNACYPGQLHALFSPQHGLWSEQQANMIESPHTQLGDLQLVVHSLYSETRRPSAQMLQGLDFLVIDLQDVGSRIYTFIWTMVHCMQACAELGLPVVVLDRPNPLAGTVEGPILAREFHSFVGLAPLPLKHDLTIGEVAKFVNQSLAIGADLQVIPLANWSRGQAWPETRRVWIPTSPNLPSYHSLQVYPGQVLFEGTNVSEGRGTTCPFEILGAPWIDGQVLARCLDKLIIEGVTFRPIRFLPTFDKWQGNSCGGIFLHPTDNQFQAVRTSLIIMALIADLWPNHFQWLPPPYEYEHKLPPIDILFGNDQLRTIIDQRSHPASFLATIDSLVSVGLEAWETESAKSRIYNASRRVSA